MEKQQAVALDQATPWSIFIAPFQTELNPQQFATWIRPLRCEQADGQVRLLAPNRFVLQWVRERFGHRIEALMHEVSGAPLVVEFGIDATEATSSRDVAPAEPVAIVSAPAREAVNTAPLSPSLAVVPSASRRSDASSLNPSLTFEAFVTGKANQLARAAGLQVADHPTSYNPLFVYGGVGLGKTHLIQAIGNHILAQNPAVKIRYIHAEAYIADVVRAYQHKGFEEFKRHYRSLDLLLIDDIQFIGGKTRTQEEFFYLFNTMIEAHKQVVITCDKYPKEIEGIEERLISRFGWGLTVALDPPEIEMRVAILLSKAAQSRVRIDEQVAFFIAKHIRSNVRELEGALKRVVAFASFHGNEITLAVAKEALKDLLAVQNRQISVENIQKTVADYYKIKVADMYSKKRPASIARPRQIAMYLAKELTQKSLPEIGELFGGRDHTTVLHAVRKISQERQNVTELNQQLHVLEQTLKG